MIIQLLLLFSRTTMYPLLKFLVSKFYSRMILGSSTKGANMDSY